MNISFFSTLGTNRHTGRGRLLVSLSFERICEKYHIFLNYIKIPWTYIVLFDVFHIFSYKKYAYLFGLDGLVLRSGNQMPFGTKQLYLLF